VSHERRTDPAFIVSCSRSGSTLLRFIVDTAPDIYCPSELFLGDAALSLAVFFRGLTGSESIYDSAVTERVGAFLDEQISSYAARRGKRRWCEKTPGNALHLPLIEAVFPSATYLCLHRHALDVAHSAIKVTGKPELLPVTIRQWIETSRVLLDFERGHPSRCHRLRYEDLVAAPGEVLPPLFAFLGARWDNRLLDTVFTAEHDRGLGDPYIRFSDRIYRSSVGQGAGLDLESLPPEIVAKMMQILDELGYAATPASPEPAAAAAGSEALSAAWLFETFLPARLAAMPAASAAVNDTILFEIEGPEGGSWLVDLRPAASSVSRIHNGAGVASLTITISRGDLGEVLRGELNASMATLTGRLRISGKVDPIALATVLQLFRLPDANSGQAVGAREPPA
jgi:hypothetical protein